MLRFERSKRQATGLVCKSMNLVEHLQKSISNANLENSKINKACLGVEGMSSAKIRHFLNNVVDFPTCRYLEIGCWKGSTIISSQFQNTPEKYWVIDNFIEFGNVRDEFKANFKDIVGSDPNLIDCGFTDLVPAEKGISDVNVYLYDGAHGDEHHAQSLKHYYSALANEFIYLVDDWNWSSIERATKRTIEELKLEIVFEQVMPAVPEGQDREQWWNGFFVSVLRKPQ